MNGVRTLILGVVFLFDLGVGAGAEPTWEFIGPGVGYLPYSLDVTEEALYLGLAEEVETGLGLWRYSFNDGEWELLAQDGERIAGLEVWGDVDQNILLLRNDLSAEMSEMLRSTDGGESWLPSGEALPDMNEYAWGLFQAPSDTSRFLTNWLYEGIWHSQDGGWSWDQSSVSSFFPTGFTFAPTDAEIAYVTGEWMTMEGPIYKSTDGGITWTLVHVDTQEFAYDIAVEWADQNHVMAAYHGYVRATTDAGESWPWESLPVWGISITSAPWLPTSFFVCGTDLDITHYEVWGTDDLGESWTSYSVGLPEAPEDIFLVSRAFLEPHPTEPILYAALAGSGVWRLDLSSASVPEGGYLPLAPRLLLHPNPGSARTSVSFELSGEAFVRLDIFDLAGKRVKALVEGPRSSGRHNLTWNLEGENGRRVPAGVYWVSLDAGDFTETRKLIVLE